eukprot:scaffold5013_cov51-Attheya_sp.AAC.4
MMMRNPASHPYPHMPHMMYPYPGMAPPYPNPYSTVTRNSSPPNKNSASHSTQKEKHIDEPKSITKATASTTILQIDDNTSKSDKEGGKKSNANDES